MAGVGNDQFSIVTQPIATFDAGVRIDLPVAVRALSVRAEEAGREQLEAIVLRPLTLASGATAHEIASRAVRYGDLNAFFLDERSYPEPAGFWVAGKSRTEVVIAADQPRASIALTIRNGGAANSVALESGSFRAELRLGPGEERHVEIPLAAPQTSLRVQIRSSSGFRPADVDGSNHDTRLLGAFVRIAD